MGRPATADRGPLGRRRRGGPGPAPRTARGGTDLPPPPRRIAPARRIPRALPPDSRGGLRRLRHVAPAPARPPPPSRAVRSGRRPQPAVRRPGDADGLHLARGPDRGRQRVGRSTSRSRSTASWSIRGPWQPDERDLFEPLVEKHLGRHGGDPGRSLATVAVPAATLAANWRASPTPTSSPL